MRTKLIKRTADIAEVKIKCLMYHSRRQAKLSVLSVLSFLLLLYGVSNVHCSTVHENSQDLHALLEFKKGINNPSDALSSWNANTHFCHWYGVNCTLTRPFRVMELNLAGLNLAGQISPSLGNLTFLNHLDLSQNNLYGPIPPLNKLQHLQNLSLGSNLLQDVIPVGLTNCSNLSILDLSKNNLTGTIPPSIGSLSKLEVINFRRNSLTGVIPPALGSITTLTTVKLDQNQLIGGIPNEFWQTSSIKLLDLHANYLSGEIPHTLPIITSLTQLSLTSNMFSGELPSNIGDALPNIQVLYLGNNSFQGPIPASLGKSSGLTKIELSLNKFNGQIPSSFGKLGQLEYLNLGDNQLEASDSEGWEFFDALSNCRYLNSLYLPNNNLQGTIPNTIANLTTNLTYLKMSGNYLSGIVPPSIGKFNSLIELTLDQNNLNGTITEWIGKLSKLEHLNLENNNFTGIIPPSISNLTQLIFLSLGANKFTDFIPSSMGNLQNMDTLNLSYNNFQGTIPVEFGNFTEITELDISFNNLGGEIPQTLGQLAGQIQTIKMDHNILTGNIPITFTKLSTLIILNVSHNNLSGPVPDYLSDLKSLEKLDLSYNNFQGEIPASGVFSNATIVLLDGNPELCGAAMDLNIHSCHVKSKKVNIADYMVKVLIPIFGFMSLVLLVYFLLLEKKKLRREHISENSFGEHFEKVTYNDLAQATGDFSESNLIGRGSYGSVYRARLKESKMEVAVKVFNLEMPGAEKSFLSECEALRRVQHRNLLPIITACSTVDNAGNVFKALVYEFMPNGNLDNWLHHKGDEEASKRHLSLTQRISIAINVADTLDYLHHDCGRPTVHCDLKPSNILLDEDMNALLGDFGIARFYSDLQSTWAGSISSIGVKGTIGYIPPEYGGGGHVSTSGDVYSFGIVLLEMLTSKRPTDSMFIDGLDIISFVENNLPDGIFQVVDNYLVEECKSLSQRGKATENDICQCLTGLLQIALSCTRSLPGERLNMKQVATKMHDIKATSNGWKYK